VEKHFPDNSKAFVEALRELKLDDRVKKNAREKMPTTWTSDYG
jgi:hypothetical protein